jgi:autotransporter-associated beta strand protein
VRGSLSSPKRLLLAAVVTHFCLIGPVAQAISFTWDGGGADDRFDTGQNWSGDVAPVSGSSTDLHFAGTARLTPSNTFSAGSDLGSIIFDAGAGAFNISGNAFNLYGRIENNSTTAQTLSVTSLSLTSTSELRVTNGDLTLGLTGSGANIFNNGNTLNVYGNNKLLTFAAGTVMTGTGGFRMPEFNTVVFNSAQTYTGATYIDAGRLFTNSTIGNNTGAIFIGNAQASYADITANLFITSSGLDFANAITTNKADTGTAKGFGGRLIDGTFTSGTSTLSGGITLNGGLTISQSTGGTLQVSGVIRDGTDTGNTAHTVNVGATGRKGTVLFTANNTFTGTVTVSAGTLEVNNTGSLTSGRIGGSTLVAVTRNATLLLSGSSGVRDRINDAAKVQLTAGTSPDVGGTLNTGGLSEGTAPTGPGGAGGTPGIGILTLRGNSTIDFTSANGGSELVCQSLDFISGTIVNIAHWTGSAGSDGLDRLLFLANPNLTTNDLRFVQFTNDAGLNFTTGGMIIGYNGYYELVPITAVPEPATWIGGALALLALVFARGHRTRRTKTWRVP